MNFEEHAAKPVLAAAGIAVPEGRLASTPDEAATAAEAIGPVVVKAQVPTGKRGKAGGIRTADGADEARAAAAAILGMDIEGHRVERLLVEERGAISRELYCSVLNDPETKGPLLMFSAQGGMDIETLAAEHPELLRRVPVDPRAGLDLEAAASIVGAALDALGGEAVALEPARDALAEVLVNLYRAYADSDAELLEVNPLALLDDGRVVALDCKLVLDDSAIVRREALAAGGSPERLTALETRARDLGLKYIELDGDVGVLANGAGLTMTTMDVIAHHGGRAANFLEIGGEAYTLARPALELVLENPGVRSLVVNFCGAFARTDVMTEGVIAAWQALDPDVPVFFSVHGTGAAEARALLVERLGVTPYPTMDEAIVAAIAAAGGDAR